MKLSLPRGEEYHFYVGPTYRTFICILNIIFFSTCREGYIRNCADVSCTKKITPLHEMAMMKISASSPPPHGMDASAYVSTKQSMILMTFSALSASRLIDRSVIIVFHFENRADTMHALVDKKGLHYEVIRHFSIKSDIMKHSEKHINWSVSNLYT